MKKSRYTEEQVIGAVKQMEAGRKAREVSRELGVSVELVGQRRDVAPVMAEHSLIERHACKLLEVDSRASAWPSKWTVACRAAA